jgi:hypothetical protein
MFNKDLYYKKYLKYKNKYIDLQNQLGGHVPHDTYTTPVSNEVPLIVSSPTDEPVTKVDIRKRSYKPTPVKRNPTSTPKPKNNRQRSFSPTTPSKKTHRLLPYLPLYS